MAGAKQNRGALLLMTDDQGRIHSSDWDNKDVHKHTSHP